MGTSLAGLTLLLGLCTAATPAGPAQETVEGAGPLVIRGEPGERCRAELEAIARALRAGDDPYLGTAPIARMRETLSRLPEGALPQRARVHSDLARKLLEEGLNEEALLEIEASLELARRAGAPPQLLAQLRRQRGLVHMRRAELANCIERHNSDCCIFPLAGGGLHEEAAPALLAQEDYGAFLERFPNDLGARWILNLAHMATGTWPSEVPERHLIPPSAFESQASIGRFVNVAPMLGVDPFDLCGGAAVQDFDGDGLLDIVATTFDPRRGAYFFRRRPDGSFEDRSRASGLADQLGGLNVLSADYDNDGDMDLLVLRGAWLYDNGRIRNSLLRNEGDGTFVDVTREAGLAEPARPTQAAAFGDFDGDGWLDIYIGNESRLETRGDGDYPSQLFRNNGDGTFADVAAAAGVTNDRFAKGVAVGDYDDDGNLDIYVSNVGRNRLYRNLGHGTFADVAAEAGVLFEHRTFACWFFDYDNDGRLDLFVASYDATVEHVAADHLGLSHPAHAPGLFRNLGDGTFANVSQEVGLTGAYQPMGASFADVNGDGWLDIYLATGEPSYEALVPNVLLLSDRGRRFLDATTVSGLGHLQKGHGVAFADFDQDGDLDLYHQLGGFYPGDAFHNVLFENPGPARRFLVVELEGRRSNRQGIGARLRVVVETEDGPREIHRAAGSVSSFGTSPARQEIGLGDALRVALLEIRWPSGQLDRFEQVPLDARVRATEAEQELERLPYDPLPLRAAVTAAR